MKRERALRLVGELVRYRDWHVRHKNASGAYVRSTVITKATARENRLAELTMRTHEGCKGGKRCHAVINVPIDKIKTSQRALLLRQLRYHLRHHPHKKRPSVIGLKSGWFILWDGNHRTTAAAMLGETHVKCRQYFLLTRG